MYLTFKEKLNSLKNFIKDRQRFDQIQVYVVAVFWVLFTSLLLYMGHKKEHGKKGYVSVPEISTAKTRADRIELNFRKW